jgi:hypothetical protein
MVLGAFATTDIQYTFKQYNDSAISRPCFSSFGPSGWCSSGTVCQLTVTDPDSELLVNGSNMTNQIFRHNLTLPILNKTGIYKADMACNDNNLTGYDSFFFGVNPAGKNYNTSIAPYFLLTLLIGLIVLFAYFGFKVEVAMRMVFLTLAVLLLPVSLWVGLDIARNSFIGEAVINVLSTGFYVSFIGFVGFVFYVLISLLSQLKINKTISIPNNKASPYYWNKKKEYKENHRGEEYE